MTLRRGNRFWGRKGGGGALAYTPLLDVYNNSTAAFSVRKLRSAYTGPCMRIADSSNVQTDIGFDSNGLIDVSAIYAHVGFPGPLSAAYVSKWYDQSGNGNDLTAPLTNTSRKQISFTATGVFYVNGLPALYGNASGNGAGSKSMAFSGVLSVGSLFITGGPIVSLTTVSTIGWYGANVEGWFVGGTGVPTGWGIFKGGSYSPQNTVEDIVNQHLWEYTHDGTNRNIWTDGANFATAAAVAPQIIEIGRTIANGGGANFTANMPVQEYIIFSDDKTADRTGIESNINSYFSIY